MVQPYIESPLGGLLGVRTFTFYRLNAAGTQRVEPIGDLISSISGDGIALDMVDSEDVDRSYQVTTNALQDFTSATSNVHRELQRITVSGTLVSSFDVGRLGSDIFKGLRSDLIKVEKLEALADRREPIFAVSPRVSLPRAFIESISRSWNPAQGENTLVTISLVEARVVSPQSAAAVVPDEAASLTGNNSITKAGSQAAPPVETQTVTPGAAPGLAPFVVGE